MDAQRSLVVQGEHRLALPDMMQLGKVFYTSGLFADLKSEAQATVKILAGSELGFPPMASMMGIDIVMGKTSLSADLMAALVKRDGKYNFRIIVHTANECTIEFYEGGKLAYTSHYTIEMARQAGLTEKPIWKQYPRNMLYARAMSNGAKVVCPERMAGVDVGDDLSVPVEAGESPVTPQEQQAAADKAVEELTGEKPTQPTRPYTAEQLKEWYTAKVITRKTDPTADGYPGLIAGCLDLCFAGQADGTQKVHSLVKYLTGKASRKDLLPQELRALGLWLEISRDSGGALHIGHMAEKEAQVVITQVMLDSGQGELPLDGQPEQSGNNEIPW